MSKVYSLILTDGNPYDGVSEKILTVSQNKAQLDYLYQRVSALIGSGETSIILKEISSYKPKNTDFVLVVVGENSDISYYSSSILNTFFDNETGKVLAEQFLSITKKNDDFSCSYFDKYPVLSSLSHKDIDSVLKEVSIYYLEIEKENAMKKNGTYWMQ